MTTLEIKNGHEIYKDGKHVWNAEETDHLKGCSNVFTEQEFNHLCGYISFNTWKYKRFKKTINKEWGISLVNKGSSINIPKGIEMKAKDENGERVIYFRGEKIINKKSFLDDYGYSKTINQENWKCGDVWNVFASFPTHRKIEKYS